MQQIYNYNMLKFLTQIGLYFLLLKKVFSKPEKRVIYYKQTMREFVNLGLTSIGIIAIISFFMGAVITLQTAYNTENPIYPKYLIGLGCRDSMILEFSSTIAALILAGKVGSNIASEIGTMRVTEQIDALEIMGVNSASYLILPKIIATLIFNPILGEAVTQLLTANVIKIGVELGTNFLFTNMGIDPSLASIGSALFTGAVSGQFQINGIQLHLTSTIWFLKTAPYPNTGQKSSVMPI